MTKTKTILMKHCDVIISLNHAVLLRLETYTLCIIPSGGDEKDLN